jgi:hypothetical protein
MKITILFVPLLLLGCASKPKPIHADSQWNSIVGNVFLPNEGVYVDNHGQFVFTIDHVTQAQWQAAQKLYNLPQLRKGCFFIFPGGDYVEEVCFGRKLPDAWQSGDSEPDDSANYYSGGVQLLEEPPINDTFPPIRDAK